VGGKVALDKVRSIREIIFHDAVALGENKKNLYDL